MNNKNLWNFWLIIAIITLPLSFFTAISYFYWQGINWGNELVQAALGLMIGVISLSLAVYYKYLNKKL